MKHHKNRAGSKRRFLQAVFYKLYGRRYGQQYSHRRNFAINALSAAALLGSVTLGWAKDDNSNTAVLPEVVVTGRQDTNKGTYTTQDLSLGKYTQPLLDTPQSVSVVSRQLMDDQHVTTMRDAVRNVAGISIAAGESGAQGDNLTLRGFTARNDIFLDGMRDFGSYYRDSFDYEKVEVLKGPSSIAFGRGSTGGVINQVSKQPEDYREMSGEVALGSDLKERTAVDINAPIPQFGKGTAFRLNLVQEDSHVTDRDVVKNDHFGAATALAFGLGTPTRLTLNYLHEQQDDIPDYGIPWLYNAPANVDRHNFYGFKSDFLKTNADIGTVKVEHDISDDVSLRDQVRFGNYTREMRATEPKFTTNPSPTVPLTSLLIPRNELNVNSRETFLQNQFDVTSKFNTAFVEHTVVTGIEAGRETSNPTRYTITGVTPASLVHPNYDQDFTGTSTAPTDTYVTSDSIGVYGIDTLKLNEHWEVTGGARWDQFTSRYKQTAAASSAFTQTDKMPSYRGALVYKPVEQGSIYFDYGTSFNPSAEALSLSASTSGLAPEKNETYEVGTKWDLFAKKMTVRSAIFRTEKTNARETDPNNSLSTVLAGDQRVDGIEVEAAGHVTDKWQISTGYAFMKSRLESSQFFPGAVGSELANVPQNTFNFWTTYELPWKMQMGGGGDFVDSRTASSTVPIDPTTGDVKEVPSYWVFNAMVGYHLTKNVDLQLNVYNLANKYYYDQVHPSHIVPGEGRTAVLSTKFKF